MKEFWNLVLDGITPIAFLVYSLYALAGMFINMVFDFIGRDPLSPNSPKIPSISFWFKDNWRRFVIAFIIMPFAIILSAKLTGTSMNIANAFMAGFCSDSISNIYRRRTSLTQVKL